MIEDNFTLNIPQRQSPLAIAFILIKFLRQAARRFWPLLIILFFNRGGEESYMAWVLGALIVISFLQLILSLISYYKYYFHVKDGELIIQKGVLQKVMLNIPLDRIQTINFQQNLLHQILNVVSVEVDTAGSSKSELSIDALSREKAEALRDYILRKKEELLADGENTIEGFQEDSEKIIAAPLKSEGFAPDREVFTFDIQDLIKVGVSGNHIRTAFVILGSLFGLLQFVEGSEEEIFTYLVGEAVQFQDTFNWTWILAGIIPLLMVSFVVTLVRTVLRYYGLRLWETEKGFKLIAGLFNRQEQSAAHRKIQIVRWFTDPLKRIFGLYTVRLYQASSQEVSAKKSITIPGCFDPQLEDIVNTNFPKELRQNYTEHTISPLIITRHTLYFGIIPALILAGLKIAGGDLFGLMYLLWIPFVGLVSLRYQKYWRWWINIETLKTRSGIIGNRHTLIHLYKVQAVKISQSPYQQRKALATVNLYTAAGNITIPYISLSMARKLRDYVLFKSETGEIVWM